MKKLFVVLFLALSIHSYAQTDEQKVLQRVKQLNDAIFVVKDSVALESLMADKVTYGHSGGKIENRQEMIHGAISNTGSYSNVVLDGTTIYFEDNTAIVRHVLTATAIDKDGKQSPLHLNILQVWIKQNKQWKLTARQAVKI
ncbi:MAG: nuclear transport factor 2 family protein [Bacteroidota bacterium]